MALALHKFLTIYHGNAFRDGDGVDVVTMDEYQLETVCDEYMLCRKDKEYLQVKVDHAKQLRMIDADEVVE